MATFCREQRSARKTYLRQFRVAFDTEVEEGREHRDRFAVFFPTEAECEAEAWENYLFDHVIQFDEDQTLSLVSFRSFLHVQPQHPDDYDRALSLDRTTALWSGLRRVYFGEQEPEPPTDQEAEYIIPAPSHDQIGRSLRAEIASLERRVRPPSNADDGRHALLFRHEDDDDSNPPHPPFCPPVGPTALAVRPLSVALQPDPSDNTSSADAEGSQSERPTDFLSLSLCTTSQHEQFPLLPSQSNVPFKHFSPGTDNLDRFSIGSSPPIAARSSPFRMAPPSPLRKLALLSQRVLRRVLAAK
jgi:hypothetical protein